jgi:hypothetical protein
MSNQSMAKVGQQIEGKQIKQSINGKKIANNHWQKLGNQSMANKNEQSINRKNGQSING